MFYLDHNSKPRPGFTLIELLVAIVIISVITTFISVSLNSSRIKARDAKRVNDVKQIQGALEIYKMDEGTYPPTLTPGSPLTGPTSGITYMSKVPSNPSPRADGSCPNSEYSYSQLSSGTNYVLYYCIGSTVSDHPANVYSVNPEDLFAAGFVCGTTTVSYDGETYNTVLIGAQCWLATNLNIGTRINGAGNQANNSILEKYCYDDSTANCTTYGGLYQWAEAMQYASSCNGTGAAPNDACASPVRGICPSGWHIPSHYEWTTLERAICDSGTCSTDFPYDTTTAGWRGTNEGTRLKSGGSSGFVALLGGLRTNSATFAAIASQGYFWSSLSPDTEARKRYVFSGNTTVERSTMDKLAGASVRCIRN